MFFRAATNCDLFVLTKEDLDSSLKYYPHIGEQIREVAGNRANLVKKRSQAAAKAAAEGKSASDAAKAAAEVSIDTGCWVYAFCWTLLIVGWDKILKDTFSPSTSS